MYLIEFSVFSVQISYDFERYEETRVAELQWVILDVSRVRSFWEAWEECSPSRGNPRRRRKSLDPWLAEVITESFCL